MKTVIPRTEVLIRYVKLAERLVLQNDGKLPSVTWLKTNGHAGLYQYMRAHPEAFRHISQNWLGVRSYDEKVKKRQVALAERLARRNGGILPTVTRLTNRNHSGLLSYIWKHPEFFAHIKREIDKKSPQEHIADAEALARKHGGRLPGNWAIVLEGGWALYRFMRRNHELFIHISGAPKPEKQK